MGGPERTHPGTWSRSPRPSSSTISAKLVVGARPRARRSRSAVARARSDAETGAHPETRNRLRAARGRRPCGPPRIAPRRLPRPARLRVGAAPRSARPRVVLPEPDAPNNASTPGVGASNATSSANVPRRVGAGSRALSGPSAGGPLARATPTRQPARPSENEWSPDARPRVATGLLQRGVKGERQRARLAGYVRRERDHCAEFTETRREGCDRAGEHAGVISGSVIVKKRSSGPRRACARPPRARDRRARARGGSRAPSEGKTSPRLRALRPRA